MYSRGKKQNKKGPIMDPCGTAQEIGAESDVNDRILTEKSLTLYRRGEPQ